VRRSPTTIQRAVPQPPEHDWLSSHVHNWPSQNFSARGLRSRARLTIFESASSAFRLQNRTVGVEQRRSFHGQSNENFSCRQDDKIFTLAVEVDDGAQPHEILRFDLSVTVDLVQWINLRSAVGRPVTLPGDWRERDGNKHADPITEASL
jgi:hypothetical protein